MESPSTLKVYVTSGALMSELEAEWDQPTVREQALTEYAWPTFYEVHYTMEGAVATTILALEAEFRELYKGDDEEDIPVWYWKTGNWKDSSDKSYRYQYLTMYSKWATGTTSTEEEDSLVGAVVIRETEVKP